MWLRIAAVSLILFSWLFASFFSHIIAVANSYFEAADSKFTGLIGGIIGALVTATVAWIALRTNAAVNIRNKRMDVILHCNSRYDDLYKLRNEIDKEDSGIIKDHLINSYFRRYWGLQSDQIDYWLAGYVDPETMSSWVVSLANSLRSKAVGPNGFKKSYRKSWDEDAKHTHRVVNGRLRETVVFARRYIARIDLPKERYAAALQYLRIIETNEQSLIRRLSRNLHRRMDVDELATTLKQPIWYSYNRLDTRFPPFRWRYQFGAWISRCLSTIPDWLQGNRMKRLQKIVLSSSRRSSD